ncbi:hypothetical protein [Polynucleobacter sp. MG-27-Goln-C1]|uniref:hypothetical protein n=1 Tax=Polynucleobacter sp. MG-27-Goln-C1 TaxID=1819726 RepID=UPI001C0CD509|nr:hypothetical protein [Polynucleobacter sp. MG-27-Goln-C1]MBU3611396.1 hypothetical protein [Polynucleobacter sp. MG-27-Goln-C1]
MKPSNKFIIAGLFTVTALSAQAQVVNQRRFTQNYKDACMKQQVQLHTKLKEISADSFAEYCECATRQLMTNLSPAQIKELNQSEGRPAWLKAAEQSASKACLKEGPGIRV